MDTYIEMTADPDQHHQEWLSQIRAGQQVALEQLYRALSGNVYAFVLRRVGNTADADSIVVDTFHEVWKKASTFSGHSKVKTWVLGIARHKLLDVLRSRRHQTSDIDDYADVLEDQSPQPFEQLAEQQQATWVASCMEKLPIQQRECLHLFFYEGMSLIDISEVQSTPVNTIKTRLFHAKQKIKTCLSRWLSASAEEEHHD